MNQPQRHRDTEKEHYPQITQITQITQIGPVFHLRNLQIASLCLSLCLCVSVVESAVALPHHKPHKRAHGNAKELRHRLTGMRARMHVVRARIRQTRQTAHYIRENLETVEGRIRRTEASLKRTQSRLAYLGDQQELLKERIVATQHRLDGRRRVLAMRVRQNYEQGDTTYMQVLMRSRDMHDYMSRSYYMQRMVQSDVQLVAGIKADQKQLADDKAQLDAEAKEQQELRVRQEREKEQYAEDAGKKRELLQEKREELAEDQATLDEMAEESSNIESDIRALSATPRGRQRRAELHNWTGSFIKPADGPITSGFGNRFHPILHRYRMHTGIDIGAGYGSSIRAAAGGEVIFSGSRRGYGNCVIIDHGGGVSTLYGHCSALLVSEGASVHQGQTIARVGMSGLATGPHLHFEVRHNGTPVNPR